MDNCLLQGKENYPQKSIRNGKVSNLGGVLIMHFNKKKKILSNNLKYSG